MLDLDIDCIAKFKTADEAFQAYYAGGRGDLIILHARKYFLMTKAQARKLEGTVIPFFYVFDRELPDGSHRIITVPVNDR